MAIPTVAPGDEVLSEDHNEIAGLLNGTPGYGQPVLLTDFLSTTVYAATLGQQDTTNGLICKYVYGDPLGTPVTVMTVAKAGLDVALPARIRGAGTAGTSGFAVDATGRVGMIDAAASAWAGALGVQSSVVISKSNSTINEVFFDVEHFNSYPGALADSGTATAGGATTLTDSGKSWTVNAYAGKFVRLVTGTGSAAADPFRYIVSNTSTALTVTPAWTTNPASGTTYQILTPGDMGASRFIMHAYPLHVASIRALEAQVIREAGSAQSGVKAIELGVHTEVANLTVTDQVGIDLFSSTAFLANGGAAGHQAGVGIHIYGDLGWAEYFRMSSTAGVMQARMENGGHLSTVGKVTAGATTAGTSILTVKQSSDDTNGGITVVESAAATQIAQLFTGPNGADPALYLQSAKQGVNSGLLRLGSTAADTALRIASATGLAGDLCQLQVASASPVFAVTKDGYVKIGGTKVLGTQGAAVADATGAGDVVAQLNALLARARAHGWIAT